MNQSDLNHKFNNEMELILKINIINLYENTYKKI